jgi:hypothetical protein
MTDLVAQWKELTRELEEHQARIRDLADKRAKVTRELYESDPGYTYRSLARLLGCSPPNINFIMHHGEPKPGRKISREGGNKSLHGTVAVDGRK